MQTNNLVPALPPRFLDRYRRLMVWAIMAIVIAIIANYLPRGFDYLHVFAPHLVPKFFVPWTDGLLYLLPWPILVAITIMSLVIAIERNHGPAWLLILAIFSLPTIWVLFLGALEGVALLGLVLLPWSLPIKLIERAKRRTRGWWLGLAVLVITTTIGGWILFHDQGPKYRFDNSTVLGTQPQIGLALILLSPWIMPLLLLRPQLLGFTLFARKNWMLVGAAWLVLSIVIWGFWLPALLAKVSPELKADQPQNVSLFPWSLIFALPMLWLSRKDPDMLMATGSFISPSVLPYYYMVLMPSLARLPRKLAVVCWASSFLPLTANYFGPSWWLTGNIFPLLIWFGLWREHKRPLFFKTNTQAQKL
jgi:hypothetical protein